MVLLMLHHHVINGGYGNGSDRTNALMAMGCDPGKVQERVNAILKGNATPSKSIALWIH